MNTLTRSDFLQPDEMTLTNDQLFSLMQDYEAKSKAPTKHKLLPMSYAKHQYRLRNYLVEVGYVNN